MNMIHGALDFSGPGAVFALEKNGEKVFEVSRLMQRRDAATLALFMKNTLNENGLDFEDITHWTVGSGPGSFTGMRIAASLVQGLTYGKSVKSRTVPSAEAVAEGAGGDRKSSCVIFDGRNREIILLDLKSGKDAILNKEQAEEFFKNNSFESFSAMSYDKNAIMQIIPDEVFGKIKWADGLKMEAFFNSENSFDDDLTKLIYIRPSVAGAKE